MNSLNKINKLMQVAAANNLHHALLFTGANVNYLQDLAQDFASLELCLNKTSHSPSMATSGENATSCKECQSCKLFAAKSHPDFFYLDEAENTIKIDNIRNLIEFVSTRQQISDKKMAVISNANKLNIQASNALLKTLEEPISNTTLILLAKAKQELLPTIVSRCLEVKINSVTDEDNNAPSNASCNVEIKNNSVNSSLHISEFLQDDSNVNIILQDLLSLITTSNNMIGIAEKWNSAFKPLDCSNAIYNIIYLIMLTKNQLFQDRVKLDSDILRKISLLSNYISKYKAFVLLDSIINFKRQLKLGHNPNLQMFLERLLTRMSSN